ncbi:hypothetical protein [Providencia rettgeri]|uniref:hypothetical protein n=1 Tax=Providencia rettgeri TaxID=587 RepID=UPI001183610A|nr:hypothetical protein [Providencia rettgeri]
MYGDTNKYFKGGEPTWANACVGENGEPSYAEYSSGYSKAANVLLDAVISDEGVHLWVDDFIYPICFNFRHSIELRLKDICQNYIREIFIIKNKGFEFNHSGTHDIGKIWGFVKTNAIAVDRSTINYIEKVDEFIVELSCIDATGQVFRYPYSNESEKHLIKESTINVILLKEQFNMVEGVLKEFSDFMSEALDDYAFGYFSDDLSRNDLIDIAKSLPTRGAWREPLFLQVKNELKSKYALSNRSFSRAIEFIENTHDLARMIELELPLYGSDKDSVKLAFVMSKFYLDYRNASGLAAENGIITVGPEDFNVLAQSIRKGSKRVEIIMNRCDGKLSSESISGIRALYYSDGNKSKEYQRTYELFNSAGSEIKDLVHVIKKNDFPFKVVRNLFCLGQLHLADELKSKFTFHPTSKSTLERLRQSLYR